MSMPCKDCAAGTIHTADLRGRVETLHGLPTYIAEPPDGQQPKGIIVFICDAFGWELPNNRALSDNYAKRTGCRVYCPDFVNGHWLRWDMLNTFDALQVKGSWLNTVLKIYPAAQTIINFIPFMFFNRLSVTQPRVFDFFKSLRATEAAALPLGAAGFCFGGKFAVLLAQNTEKAANGRSLIDAAFTAHPSLLVIPADIQAVQLPLSVSIGNVDMAVPAAQCHEMKEVLEGKDATKHEVVIIENAKHGFAVRGNPVNKVEMEQAKQAEDQAVNWFLKWFEKSR